MTGASIETTLELWASSLRDVKGRMRPLFTQERVAASAGSAFLDGLLGAEPRKTGGCERKRRAIGAPGASRRSWPRTMGRRCVARHCARLRAETLADPTLCWFLMRRAF